MKVLSLFDGMSCGRIALERAGIPVKAYYASEIDKYARIVSEKNYPDIIRLGDVTKWREWKIPRPDMIIGGSPCQGFSFAGKGLNFEDPRSKLFFTFADIVKHYKPRYFLLENVKMKKEHQKVITDILGVEPVEINSALVSAQNRKRLYWTNIPGVTQPEDRGLFLRDIIEDATTEREKAFCLDANYHKGATVEQYQNKSRRQLVKSGGNLEPKITADGMTWRKLTPLECERLQTVNTIYELEVELCLDQIRSYVNAVEKSHKLQKLVLSVEKNALIEFAKLVVKNIQPSNLQIKHIAPQSVDILIQKIINKCTAINQKEKNIIVDFAEKKTMSNYQDIAADFVIQNVFTNIIQEKIINTGKAELHLKGKNLCYQSIGKKLLKMSGKEIMQFVEIADMIFQKIEIEKCIFTTLYLLNMKNIDQMLIILYWYAKIAIDIFTQIEIQEKNILLKYSFENSYTNHVSNTQRYKMLGNGWTVDVIAHIFKGLKNA